MELLHRDADVASVDVDARTITVRLCRWNDPRPVADVRGARVERYREQWAPGSLRLADRAHVLDAHFGNLIGRAIELHDDDDGPSVELHIAPTAAGRDALALVDSGIVSSVSMEFAAQRDGEVREGDLVTRTAATVHGVAFAFRPAHDAPILQREQDPPMTDVMPDTPTLPVLRAEVLPEVVELRSDLDSLRSEFATFDPHPAPVTHRAAEWDSLGEYFEARREQSDVPGDILVRALADQTTVNNPGVVPPGWVSEVFGITDAGRPLITAFGVRALPASGMDVNWPYFAGNLKTLVGEQATQKTAITSVRVDLLKGTEALRTFAGGSDLSYQLIRRSSPSYKDTYVRIMMAAYSAVTDTAASADALASATAGPTINISTGGADAVRAALFAASGMVAAATGSPASFALASPAVFRAIGGLPGLYPSGYGTSNVAGTADAASLTVNVSGLPVIHAPYLADNNLIVSNRQAGGWFEDGPFTVTAEDVEKLGQNVAVWGMGAFGAFVPGGIIKLAPTLPAEDEGGGTQQAASKTTK